MPQRIQRKRVKGWQMPEDAIYVGRPTKWGNPFALNEIVPGELVEFLSLPGESLNFNGMKDIRISDRQRVIDIYTYWLISQPGLMLTLDELKGRDLACWCSLKDKDGNPVPCHADILLDVSNGG